MINSNGSNYLSGGLGADQLVGSYVPSATEDQVTSADIFAFDEISFGAIAIKHKSSKKRSSGNARSAPQPTSFGEANCDIITNFASLQGDKIGVSFSSFKTDAIRFKSVSAISELSDAFASDSNFIYDQSTGSLFYNQNGTAQGVGNGGVFAKFEGNPTLAASDFTLI